MHNNKLGKEENRVDRLEIILHNEIHSTDIRSMKHVHKESAEEDLSLATIPMEQQHLAEDDCIFINNKQQSVDVEVSSNNVSDLIGEGVSSVLHPFAEFKDHSNEEIAVINGDAALHLIEKVKCLSCCFVRCLGTWRI
jgi:hypothetical protein